MPKRRARTLSKRRLKEAGRLFEALSRRIRENPSDVKAFIDDALQSWTERTTDFAHILGPTPLEKGDGGANPEPSDGGDPRDADSPGGGGDDDDGIGSVTLGEVLLGLIYAVADPLRAFQ
jgi:hypothetical protein